MSRGNPVVLASRSEPARRVRTAHRREVPEAAPPQRDSREACFAALDDAGVKYSRIATSHAAGVDWPMKLTGTLGGVRIQGASAEAPTNYLDCRLARALLAWAPQLRAANVVGLQHYSMFRQGAVVAGAGTVSGHAHGFAIDVASFTLGDGRKLSVLDDWTQRARGADPCGNYSDSDAGARMRELVCGAAEGSIFQMVLTPHYNDAHGNHVHLEISDPGAAPFVR